MKVITASTEEQQKYVKELIEQLYERIFPCFFSLEYIQKLKEFKLMEIPNIKELSLAEIMEVTAAVQTISTILEETAQTDQSMTDYQSAFDKNASILSKYEIDFPFQLSDFCNKMEMTYYSHENTFYI